MSSYNTGNDNRTEGYHDGGAFGNNRDSGYRSGNSGASTNAGPHDSNAANKLDPRVDSDRDGSRTAGNTTTGTNHSGYGGNTNYDNPRSTNAGPHDSSLGNKADPRVDSDRDGRGTGTGTGYGSTTGNTGGYGSNTVHHDNPHSTNAGPHDSNLANKADPRVDSDRDGRGTGTGHGNNTGYGGNTGYGNNSGYGSGTTGGSGNNYGTSTRDTAYDNPRSTNDGPHGSNLGNKLDPRIDSDRDNRGGNTYGGHNTGYGNDSYGSEGPAGITSSAQGHGNGGSSAGTSGPHKSKLANIFDPKVDSNNVGSGPTGAGATANSSVSGSGPTGAPEGQASASGPTSATANTTTSNNPVKGAFNKLAGRV